MEEIPAKDVDHIEVSSTKIRNALLIGDVKTATNYLGHEYTLTGTVVKGKQLGRTIGYPTANLLINDQHKLIPGDGVYAVKIKHKNSYYGGMLNIGNNPTVEGKGKSIEVNIFDFDKVIYGDEATIYFIDRLRDEVKFKNLDDLKEQLAKDKIESLQLINSTFLHKA